MKRRVIVIVAVALLALGLSVSFVAAQGPPWQAEVCNPGAQECEACTFPWVVKTAGGYELGFFEGTISGADQPLTGLWHFKCSVDFDFDDPAMATIEEAGPVVESIFGDLVFYNKNIFMVKGFACSHGVDVTTHNTLFVVNSSGQATGVCLFNPLRP